MVIYTVTLNPAVEFQKRLHHRSPCFLSVDTAYDSRRKKDLFFIDRKLTCGILIKKGEKGGTLHELRSIEKKLYQPWLCYPLF